MSNDAVDYRGLTERQQATWATGDFNEVARQIMGVSELLVADVDPRPGQRVLDVACGSGNAALVAARRYCDTSGVDYVPELIERARQRAAAEGVRIDFQVGDAQSLPYPDASFDVILSVFGVMFAPDQVRAAQELLRVCRPGGKIGLACWMPTEFGGEFFGAHAKYVPPPPGLTPPVRWGTAEGIQALLGAGCRSIHTERKSRLQYYRSTDHMIEIFRKYFGPMNRAFSLVEPARHDDMHRDFTAVLQRYNRSGDDTLVLETAYLETIAIRA
jgi:SAM-dependent methyltransferase